MGTRDARLAVARARCATGPHDALLCDIRIARGRITEIRSQTTGLRGGSADREVDLSGYLLLPGLINAHDHLEFALYPRLGNPPYHNYVEWGQDIHKSCADLIAQHHAVPIDVRARWGGIRNLLSGVTTVAHHNPLLETMRRNDFPVRVIQQYGWAHSVALAKDICAARQATPAGSPFMLHACEGVDELAREEVRSLDALGLLDESTVLVHGLALDADGVALIKKRGASLVICPSSNHFLFRKLPDLDLLRKTERVVLGSDSPLTAGGDLLDEIRFLIHACNISPPEAFRMVTSASAAVFRLSDGEGAIKAPGVADLIAIRDTGGSPAERLGTLSMDEVELVLLSGNVMLASDPMMERLPDSVKAGLEPLLIGETIRWVRAPVNELLERAEAVFGEGQVRLAGRLVRAAAACEVEHAG